MARDEWQADIKAQRISHRTLKFHMDFEGDPTSDHCDGRPGKFPDGLTALQKVRLVREAFDYYIEAWKESRTTAFPVKVSAHAPEVRVQPSRPAMNDKPRLGLRKPSTD
jgi:hypothetical protein